MAVRRSRPCVFLGSSRKALNAFPERVRNRFGYSKAAHTGPSIPCASQRRSTCCTWAVYTVRFAEAVYVLHAFQKKSTSGIATPKHELDLIRARLREAEASVKRISSRGPT